MMATMSLMPFGLTNAPATFQALMNQVFQPFLKRFVLVFFNDILIYSISLEEHVGHLAAVFDILRSHSLYAKRYKYSFGQPKVKYLGHVITGERVSTDPSKIKAMVEWPTPKSLKAIRGFLGLTGYYRKYVVGYGTICRPLTDLLKNYAFKWNDEAELAFVALKSIISSTPVLILPDFTKEFILETDASHSGIGVVLIQKNRPVAYFSKVLAPKHRGKSIYEKEYMALLIAIDKWRHYLQFKHFVIRTDHHSLKYLMEQRVTSALQQKRLTKLLGLDYEIQYKKGAKNRVADALSRQEDHGKLSAISASIPSWMQVVTKIYDEDPQVQDLITQLSIDLQGPSLWHYSSGILIRRGKVYIGANGELR